MLDHQKEVYNLMNEAKSLTLIITDLKMKKEESKAYEELLKAKEQESKIYKDQIDDLRHELLNRKLEGVKQNEEL